MKKIYLLLSLALIAMLLAVGIVSLSDTDATFSVSENRSLKTMPSISAEALIRGNWLGEYLAYYSDTFPAREKLLQENQKLNNFYYFTALADEDDVQIVIDFQSNAAHGGEALEQAPQMENSLQGTPLNPTQPTQTAESTETAEPTEPTETEEPAQTSETEPESTEPTEDIPEPTEPEAPAEDLGQAILVGNRAMYVPKADYNTIASYANSVNAIADALGSDVRTFCITAADAAAFYAPKEYRTGDHDQKAMIDYCYSKLQPNVITVDAYPLLAQHSEEYLYFRTDHHWTQLGAYYTYLAFCESAGFEPYSLDAFETGSYKNFVGSMYTYLSAYPQASILKTEPDTLYYYRPFVDLNTTYYEDASLDYAYAIGTICHINENVSNKYLAYLGGDHPVTIIETDVEGPVCVLLKESFGNAFAPWLTSHYSKVIAIDPREFNRDGMPNMDLVKFVQEQNVSDCIILDYSMMINSAYYAQWLGRMVEGY